MKHALPSDLLNAYSLQFKQFVRTSNTGLVDTLLDLWQQLVALGVPFEFSADNDMAKFTFPSGRGFHIATSTKRFHRPKKTRKLHSVTIIMGGFKEDYDDPEDLLIPCNRAGKIDCCYFGMGEEEADLAMFFIEQLARSRGK